MLKQHECNTKCKVESLNLASSYDCLVVKLIIYTKGINSNHIDLFNNNESAFVNMINMEDIHGNFRFSR